MRTITPEPPTVIVEEILDAGGAGDAGDAGRPDGTPSAETSGRIPFAALILALVAGGMAVLLVLNTATAATEVKQRGIDQANATLYDQEQQLSRDVADLQSPEELAKRAAKLGLIPADAPAFIRINGDGSVTVLGSPAPATTQPPVVTPAPTPTAAAATDPAPPATATQTPTPSPTPSVTPGPSVTPATATPSPTQAPTPTVTLPGGPR